MIRKLFLAAVLIIMGQTAFSQISGEKTTGYTNITELNFTQGFASQIRHTAELLVLKSSNYPFSYGIQTINGYKFNDRVLAGIGVGFDRYQYGSKSLPVFADLRVSFGQEKIRPFMDQNAGFAFDVFNEYEQQLFKTRGAYFLGSSFGFAFPSSFGNSLNLSLGYRGFYRKTEFHFYREIVPIHIFSHFLTFKAGLTF